jgi:hypothetical protein
MRRSQSSSVNVKGIRFRKHVGDSGEEKAERQSILFSVGTLLGLDVLDGAHFQELFDSMRQIQGAYDSARDIDDDAAERDFAKLSRMLTSLPGVMRGAEALLRDDERFFQNDFSALCFVVDDKPDRYQAARFAMQRAGLPTSKDRAKQWLSERESRLKEQHKVDKLEIVGP